LALARIPMRNALKRGGEGLALAPCLCCIESLKEGDEDASD